MFSKSYENTSKKVEHEKNNCDYGRDVWANTSGGRYPKKKMEVPGLVTPCKNFAQISPGKP